MREFSVRSRTQTGRQCGRRTATGSADRRTSPSSPAAISSVDADCRISPAQHRRQRRPAGNDRTHAAVTIAARGAAVGQRQEEEGEDDVHRTTDLRTREAVRTEEIPVAQRAGAHGGPA